MFEDKQNLNEDFIKKYHKPRHLPYIIRNQQLSKDFIENSIPKNVYDTLLNTFQINFKSKQKCDDEFNWIRKSTKFKINQAKIQGYKVKYDKDGSYILAYKSVKNNYESVRVNGIHYTPKSIHHAHCDCRSNRTNSFGLADWNKLDVLQPR